MTAGEIDALKSKLQAANGARAAPSHAAQLDELARAMRAANDDALQTFLRTTGVNLQPLHDAYAKNRRAYRSAVDRIVAAGAGTSAAEASFRGAIARRRAIDEQIRLRPAVPLLPSYYTLTKPSFVLQEPHSDLGTLIDDSLEDYSSLMKIRVTGACDERFDFVFLWNSDRNDLSITDIDTSLYLNGTCSLEAVSGFFSGHSLSLTVDAELTVYDDGGQILIGRNQTGLAHLTATSGGLFGSDGSAYQAFDFQRAELLAEGVRVQANETIIIKVSLHITASAPAETGDVVRIDFADDEHGYLVVCPFVSIAQN